jgi:hypothetical protein
LATTRLGPARLIGPARGHAGRALVVVRPEHLELAEAPDGPADGGSWRIVGRRFTGTEILLEVVAADGERLWSEAGPAGRHLRVGDAVRVVRRDVETVAFAPGRPPAAATEPVSAAEPGAGVTRAPSEPPATAGSSRDRTDPGRST